MKNISEIVNKKDGDYMADIEKVIYDLMDIKERNKLSESEMQTIDDANELLREQEAVKPLMMQDSEGIWFTCQRCGHKLRAFIAMEMDLSLTNFCSECGQAVKWK